MQTNSVQAVVEFLYLAMRDKFNWMLSAMCVSEEVLGCRACVVLGDQFQALSDKLQSVVVPLSAIIAILAFGLGVGACTTCGVLQTESSQGRWTVGFAHGQTNCACSTAATATASGYDN